jgi:hypothetical protein
MADQFLTDLERLKESAKASGETHVGALLEVAAAQHAGTGDLKAVGNVLIEQLEHLGLPRWERTQIRNILSAHEMAAPFCW